MMSKWTICSEKTSDWLIFSERPEPFAHSRSFVMSGLSDSLTSLFKKEGMSESLRIFKLTKKCTKNMILFNFFSKSLVFVSKRAIERFAKKKQAICSFALLSWATWANHSQSLFCLKQPELFSHSFSFVMSDLSNFLTVAHLSWAIWANCPKSLITMSNFEQMSNERMS